jgi:hypothetical protein
MMNLRENFTFSLASDFVWNYKRNQIVGTIMSTRTKTSVVLPPFSNMNLFRKTTLIF